MQMLHEKIVFTFAIMQFVFLNIMLYILFKAYLYIIFVVLNCTCQNDLKHVINFGRLLFGNIGNILPWNIAIGQSESSIP